jgi:two-component system response regulator ChvI
MTGGHRILVVDDEYDLTRITEMYLKSWNFEVDSFTDPIKALEHFQKNPSFFSLVLTDVRMPGMSGIELANHMLSIRPDIKIMLMTAYRIDSRDLQNSLPVVKYGDILEKPFRLKEICEGVRKQLEIES